MDDISTSSVLILEPFYGGSHKELIDVLVNDLNKDETKASVYTLPAKKWHWRARTSALYFAQIVPCNPNFRVLFCSSVLNLTEFIGLRPDLTKLKKVIYFHENQLVYPVRKHQDRDFEYGYNQIISCLTADVVLFNSMYNLQSFLSNIPSFLNLQPDHRVRCVDVMIQPKCRVLYYPLNLLPFKNQEISREGLLHIVWPHRWEHDKNPELFFRVLFSLLEEGAEFTLSVCGQTFDEVPDIFNEAVQHLDDNIIQFGYIESKEKYCQLLCSADVVVSTSNHEFFGVSMLEAVYCGCYPLCPNSLVYPEIFPTEHLYNTENQLKKKLLEFCESPDLVRSTEIQFDFSRFDWRNLQGDFRELLLG